MFDAHVIKCPHPSRVIPTGSGQTHSRTKTWRNRVPPKGMPMTERPIGPAPLWVGSPLRTPRAAALAGIIFSVFLSAALVLLRVSVPAHPDVPGAWLTDSRRRAAVAIALN